MHDVYEEAYRDAVDLKLGLCGSQLVGLLPLQAMLDVADFYIKKEALLVLEEDQKIKLVSNYLLNIQFKSRVIFTQRFAFHYSTPPRGLCIKI